MSTTPAISDRRRRLPRFSSIDPYRVVLIVLIILYVWLFASLAIQQHVGMRTHKADLGQIDQSVWNSSRGRFVEMTDNGYLSTRLIDHVEPILAFISPILWIWNDVRALLLLQVVFVEVGAWLLFGLAKDLCMRLLSAEERTKVWQAEPVRKLVSIVALALAVAYLLAPQLQSALLTEFHAIPLATPLILWAFVAVDRERWGQFVIAAVLVAVVKEEAALLAAGLGAWAMWRIIWERLVVQRKSPEIQPFPLRAFLMAAAVLIGSVAWFYVATFVIVPAYAADVYGIAESNYFQRYGALGDSPADILKSLVTQPQLVWQIASEPARLAYLRNLAMPYGFLALLAPEVVLLSLPVLLANLLSAYPAQYYGEFHYSAPVAAYFAVASAYGAARLWRWTSRRASGMSGSFQHLPAASVTTMTAASALRNSRSALRPLFTALLVLWILGWSVASYVEFGRGPGGARYDPTPVTAHHRLMQRFVEQIPSDAAVTATAAVHPHVSHRRYVYQFPLGLETPVEAEWALLDVTSNTDMAPGDLRQTVEEMLLGDWGVVDAADGFLLLQKGAPAKRVPDEFYSFVRTTNASTGAAPLALVDVVVSDLSRWRTTAIKTRWRIGKGYDPETMAPQIDVLSPTGDTLYRFADAHPPGLVWYPPEQWQPGDEITITTLPLALPWDWAVAVDAAPGLVVEDVMAESTVDGQALVGVYSRDTHGGLDRMPPELFGDPEWAELFGGQLGVPVLSNEVVFRLSGGREIALQASLQDRAYWPGDTVDVWLSWTGETDWPADQSVFVHLRSGGANVAQNDGAPRFFVLYDANEFLSQHALAPDWRQLMIPSKTGLDAVVDDLSVVVGLYDPTTGERSEVYSTEGDLQGQEFVVGRIHIEAPPTPDQACSLIPETCASQR